MGAKLSSPLCIDQAIEATGLEDFDGRTFETGLDALVDSLNHDLDLGESTASYFQHTILGVLTNRLQVTQLIKNHPEILGETIEQPIVIVGLPRSGTTMLQTLLALDPLSRYLRNYESVLSICPPPELIPGAVDPRIQACHDAMEHLFALAPNLRGINGLNFMAHGTAECQNLTAIEFVHMGWSAGSSLFSHGNWVSEYDLRAAYQWHKKLLRVLQWKSPNDHWVLKAPMHLFGLDHLLENYPDARIIFTHRDPVQAMVSGVSMVCQWTKFTTGRHDASAISNWYPALWAKGLERALAYRKQIKADQMMNISHKDLLQDPLHTIQTIYNYFDMPFGKAAKKRMQIWLKENPRSRFGCHKYSAEALGIHPEKIQELFGFYLSEFDRFFRFP